MDNFNIEYRFDFNNGQVIRHSLDFNLDNMELNQSQDKPLPEWTRLDCKKCSHCPLDSSKVKYCPAATNLAEVVNNFNDILSYEEVNVETILPDRTVRQKTTAQIAISSLMGLIISSSACPYTAFFKSMARHHLPLANHEETLCRATAFYLLSQYILSSKDPSVSVDLSGLEKIYTDMMIVNQAIVERLRDVVSSDSTLNALVLLDCYAQSLPLAIEDSLEEIEYLFKPLHDSLRDS
jgi:hypothetical protein